MIDFKRDKDGVPAKVAQIEYDPNRSARIALLHYADGEKRYIVAPQGLKVGDMVESGPKADIKPGNALPLEAIPTGTTIHNIELYPARRPVRAQRRHERPAPGQRRGLRRRPHALERAAPHQPGLPGDGRRGRQLGPLEHRRRQGRPHALARRPADRARHRHEPRRPSARRRRGQDHGRAPSGHSVGMPTLGYRTRKKHKRSDSYIIRGRKRGKHS